jgi:hypothetical protein
MYSYNHNATSGLPSCDSEGIVKELLVSLKQSFRQYRQDLQSLWVKDAEAEFDKRAADVQAAEQRVSECEAKEKGAIEAAADAARQVEQAKTAVQVATEQKAQAAGKSPAEVKAANDRLQAAKKHANKCEKDAQAAKTAEDNAVAQTQQARADYQVVYTQSDQLLTYRASRDWQSEKSQTALYIVKQTLLSQQTLAAARDDLDVVCKELRARWCAFIGSFRSYQYASPDGIKNAESSFQVICQSIYLLNLNSCAATTQQGFLHIYLAARRAEKRFKQVVTVAEQWTQHWQAYFYDEQQYLRKFGQSVNSLVTISTCVRDTALTAATSCELELQRESCEKLCAELTKLYEEYQEVVCLLDHLQYSPDLEPGFRSQVYRQLNRAGEMVVRALRALKTICISEKDQPTQLLEAWQIIAAQPAAVEQALALRAKTQCAPPAVCRGLFDQLQAAAQKGLYYALAFQRDPACRDALAGQAEAAYKLEGTLDEFAHKGLPRYIFDGFWWPLAQIHLILSGCAEEQEQCLVTDKQLDRFVEKLKTYLGAAGGQAHYGRAACGSRAPNYGFAFSAAEAPSYAGDLGEDITLTTNYAEQFKASARLAATIKPLAPAQLRPRLEEIIKQEQSWQQAKETAGELPAAAQRKQLSRYLREAHAILAATYAVALDRASGVEKQQLVALGEQLSLANRQKAAC